MLASGDPGAAITSTPGAFGDFGFGDDIRAPIYLGPSLTGWLVLSSRGRNISLHHCAVRTRIKEETLCQFFGPISELGATFCQCLRHPVLEYMETLFVGGHFRLAVVRCVRHFAGVSAF